MKSKKLLSVLCLLTLVGCDPMSTSSSSNSSSVASSSSSSTSSSSVVSSSSSTSSSSSSSTPTPVVEYASFVSFQDYGTYLSLSGVSVGDQFEIGSTQRFEFTAQYGSIDISDLEYYNVVINGSTYHLSYNTEDVNSFGYASKGYVDVVVDGDLYIYTHQPFSYTNEDGFSVNFDSFYTESYTVFGFSTEEKYTEIGFAVAPKPGYNVSEVYYTTAESSEKIIVASGNMGMYYINLTSDITLNVVTEEASYYNISYVNIENLDLEKSVLPATSTELHTVTYSFVAKEGYYIESFEVNEEAANAGVWIYGESGTFTMPSLDVTFTFSIKEYSTITVVPHSKIKNYTFYLEMDWNTSQPTKETTGYNPNTGFHITAEAIDGYAVSNIIILNNETRESVEVYKYSNYFSVYDAPACGVTVFFEVIEAKKVTLVEGENGTIQFANGSTEGYFLSGDEVNFTIVPNEGYIVKSVTASDESIYISSWDGNYYFYMGENEVTITVEFEKITYATVTLKNLTGSLTSVAVEGYTSNAYLDEVGSNSNFHVGEELNIYYNASDNKYHYSLKVTQGETTTEYTLQNYSCYGSYDSWESGELLITDSNVTIELVAEEKETINAIVNVPTTEGFDITWKVNGYEVDEIGDLYVNDTLEYSINSTPTENHKYVATYNDSKVTYPYFEITGDFTLTIEEVEITYGSYEVVNATDDGTDISTMVKIYGVYPNVYLTGTGKVESGQTIQVSTYNQSVKVVITINGEEVYDSTNPDTGSISYKYEVNDNDVIVITISTK